MATTTGADFPHDKSTGGQVVPGFRFGEGNPNTTSFPGYSGQYYFQSDAPDIFLKTTGSQTNPTTGGWRSLLEMIARDYKESVRAVASTNIALSGLQTIDGVSLVADDRILVVAQTDATKNGVWLVKSGAWIRSIDFDDSTDVSAQLVVPVSEGTTYENTEWILITNDPIVLGTTSLSFIVKPTQGDKTFNVSVTNQTTVNIAHGLGKKPSVRCTDSVSNDFSLPEKVTDTDNNNLVIEFGIPFTGTIVLN